MTDPTPQQIKKAVLRGLKQVGERFAKDPTPTDGSVQAALAIAAQRPARSARAALARKSTRRTSAKKKKANGRKRA